ncbi:MAG: outer membrane beta-barrel protein [Rhizomicrobium sp.]
MAKRLKVLLMGGAWLLASISSASAGAITANPKPITMASGFGDILVSGQISGLAYTQSNASHAQPGDATANLDLSNALITVQKNSGFLQFYVQAGLYSFPTVGQPYEKASSQNSLLGPVPVAYAKLQFTDALSLEAGQLPTLVGAELGFTPQNINIERGLLWWQEPISSRGLQVNYASGPVSLSLSWNDGYYSNVLNSFSGLLSYAIDGANSLAVDASITPDTRASLGHQIYNVMYTYNQGKWNVGPYLQFENYAHGLGSDFGLGLLTSYQLTERWSLNGRAEYETSGNGMALSYGPHSKAWSLTFTPTWQQGIFFARAELSYVGLGHQTVGFGPASTQASQVRALFETGIVF